MRNFSIPRLSLLIVCGGTAYTSRAGAQTASPLFPFVIPWDDASKTATDVSFLNPAPLEEKHRIVARDGHFYDQTGRRVRLLGANFSFSANFPDKADAEKIAARMHKYGFNIVRLHHMDGKKAPRGIWSTQPEDFQHLDADQLDRLDYLISQLKRNGIYVDLNLHVSREFSAADGFAETEKLPRNGKVTAWFEPRMVALQKQFARELLAHRNPYTQQTYGQDPAVALIEIHNEDTLLEASRRGKIAALPAFYRQQLLSGWNSFLQTKYRSTSGLLASWNGNRPISNQNRISNSRFATPTTGWTLEQKTTTRGNLESQPISGEGVLPPGRALNLKSSATDGDASHLLAHYKHLDLKEHQDYTLSFWARSDKPRQITVYSKQDQAPWRETGLSQNIKLTSEWQRYTWAFRAQNTLPRHTRLTFVIGEAVGDVWLADLALRAGSNYELEPGQSLEQGTLGLIAPSASPWGEDVTRYLMEVERSYAEGMRDYIKNDLGARGLVTCSQSSFGGLSGVWRESKMDFVDMHSYWSHPQFPRAPWDSKDWFMKNEPMVSSTGYGTFPYLAMNRVAGKPFTVSEYNHAAPNDFSAETLPLIMAYAAWQDWDGVFLFEYSDNRDNWRKDKINGYFQIDTHPGKMAFLPAAAALFLRGNTSHAPQNQTLKVPLDQVIPLSAAFNDTRNVWKAHGIMPPAVALSRLAIEFMPSGTTRVERSANKNSNHRGADAMQWSPTTGQFKFTSPQAQVAVSRYAPTTKIEFEDWNCDLAASKHGFAALALYSRDDLPIRQAKSLLLTVVGAVENTDMVWNAQRNSVIQWGRGPVLAEGITGTVAIKSPFPKAVVYALDSSGKRTQIVASRWTKGELRFRIGSPHKTLWYEIAALHANN